MALDARRQQPDPSRPPEVRAAAASDQVASHLRRVWGDTAVAVHGRLFECTALPALVALREGTIVGVLTYCLEGDVLEIVSCDAGPPGERGGTALVAAVLDLAPRIGATRVVCTTTNDNTQGLGFWQSQGFRLAALRLNGVADARLLKPGIPLTGYRGLPIRDELDLELVL